MRLKALETRVEVLEAFVETIQRQSYEPPQNGNGATRVRFGAITKKRGIELEVELSDRVDAFIAERRMQVRDFFHAAVTDFLAWNDAHDPHFQNVPAWQRKKERRP
jgi:hypothetical protein